MKWFGFALAMIAEFCLLFLFSLWLTFPSGKLADFLDYQVYELSGQTVAMKSASASPWWVGVKAKQVTLVSVPENEGETPAPLMTAEKVWVRTGLFSLLGDPTFDGTIRIAPGAEIDFDGRIVEEDGEQRLGALSVTGQQVPVGVFGALAAPFAGNVLSGTGGVDLDLDLDLPDDISQATGEGRIEGRNLTVRLTLPDMISGEGTFDLGPINVSAIDLQLEVDDGEAKVKRGKLMSDYANLDLEGAIKLDKDLSRSRLDLKLTVGELGGELAAFESLLSKAKWEDDGRYHYKIACSVGRMTSRCFRPDRKRASRPEARRGSRPELGTRLRDRDREDVDDQEAAEERRKRREERLAERRDRMRGARDGADGPRRPGEARGGTDDGGEQIDEEELDDEELEDEEDLGDEELPHDVEGDMPPAIPVDEPFFEEEPP